MSDSAALVFEAKALNIEILLPDICLIYFWSEIWTMFTLNAYSFKGKPWVTLTFCAFVSDVDSSPSPCYLDLDFIFERFVTWCSVL